MEFMKLIHSKINWALVRPTYMIFRWIIDSDCYCDIPMRYFVHIIIH